MKRILILDTETTGLDPAVDRVVEVGAILYSVEHVTALESLSLLARSANNTAEAVNRIPASALVDAGDPSWVWEKFQGMAECADAIVAHRAEFDRGFAPESMKTVRPWICSKFDLEWPRGRPGAALVELALDHDLGVAYAHRALADCDLLARLFTRCHELGVDIAAMLQRGLRPREDVIALVSYDERELARKAGFQWDSAARAWRKRMAIQDCAALPFKTRALSSYK